MCISNIGNRRPYPTNGFKSRGAVDRPSGPLMNTGSNNTALKDSLFASASSVIAKDDSESSSSSSCNKNAHIIVQHDYHDHANDVRSEYEEDHPARGGVTTPFPLKLHEMLDVVAADGHEHIVSWQPHGRCFVVHKPKEFVELLPHYFKLSKLASFQRQLNLYGFQRLTRGRDRGGYYHELFLKGKVFLGHNIQRIKVKGTGVRARSNPDQEPDFWAMPWVSEESTVVAPKNVVVGESSSAAASSFFSGALPQQYQDEDLSSLFQTSNNSFNNTGLPSSFLTQLSMGLLEPKALPPLSTAVCSSSSSSSSSGPQHVQQEDDTEDGLLLSGFGDKHFHYLDPFQPSVKQSGTHSNWTVNGVDDLLSSEADAFFEDFDFPDDIGTEIEDDNVFGDLLEQMIA